MTTKNYFCTITRHSSSSRLKRNADQNVDNDGEDDEYPDEIIYQRIPSDMKNLLEMSQKIERIEQNLFAINSSEESMPSRQKRSTQDYVNDGIEVSFFHATWNYDLI